MPRVVFEVKDPALELTAKRIGFADSYSTCGNAVGGRCSSSADRNVLTDLPEKLPGFKHLALRVSSVETATAALRVLGIPITEGPRRLGPSLA